VFGENAARVVFFMKAFQSSVADRPDHRTVTRNVTRVRTILADRNVRVALGCTRRRLPRK
jgi:hypothetical protein